MPARPVILASSSRYRRELLERLQLGFLSASPQIDETALPDESPNALVRRLSREKAEALGTSFSSHLIIGGDQIACCDGEILTKPGTAAKAEAQLRRQSGRLVTFLTGLCLLNSASDQRQVAVVETRVRFRHLEDEEIRRYVALDSPLDCAGSFKCESLGISLFSSLESSDPTALVGLPLIRLCEMLRHEGVSVP